MEIYYRRGAVYGQDRRRFLTDPIKRKVRRPSWLLMLSPAMADVHGSHFVYKRKTITGKGIAEVFLFFNIYFNSLS